MDHLHQPLKLSKKRASLLSAYFSRIYGSLIVVFLAYFEVSGQFFSTKVYRLEDGIPSNSVFDIAQTPDKTMWFLSPQGIIRYNSVSWKLEPDSIGLPFTQYSRLQVTPEGTLWAAGQSNDGFNIFFYRKNKWTRLPLPSDDEYPTESFDFDASKVATDSIVVWSSGGRLYSYDLVSLKISVPQNLPFKTIHSITGSETGQFLATDKGIYHWSKGGLSSEIINQQLSPDKLEILKVKKEGNKLYILGKTWLGFLENDSLKVLSTAISETTNNFRKYNLEVDSSSRVFFSSLSIPKYCDPETQKIKEIYINQLDFKYLSSRLFIDEEANLWIGDYRGLFKVSIFGFRSYNDENGLRENEVTAIGELGDTIIVANPQHLNFHVKDTLLSGPELPTSNNKIRILDVEVTSSGDILLATNADGALRYRNGQFTDAITDRQVANCTSIEPYRDGFLFATSAGLLFQDTSLRTSQFSNVRGGRKIRIIEDTVYVSQHNAGLLVIPPDGKEYVVESSNIQLNSTYDVVKWNGRILVATSAGVAIIRNGIIDKLRYNPGPEDVSAYAFLLYDENKLLIGTNLGVYYWDGTNLRAYNKKNGLQGSEINRNAVFKDDLNRLWIGSESGLSVFHQPLGKFEAVPDTRILSVSGREKNSILNADNTIDFNNRDVEIQFAGVTYINEDLVEYSYYLEGFEDDWSSTTATPNVRYSNLDAGEYTFRVKSRFSGFKWSEEATITFYIVPPFYQTLWFQILSVIAIAALVLALFRIRFIYLIRSRQKLKDAVHERTRDLAEKNDAIKRQNEELKQKQEEITSINERLELTISDLKNAQQQLIQAEKMASLGILSSGISHEFNNPLNFILHGVNLLDKSIRKESEVQQSAYDELFEIIYSGIDRVTRIVSSLNEFSNSRAEREDCNFHKIIESSSIFVSRKDLKDVNLTHNLQAKNFTVFGNKSKLHQLIVNVLTNAIDAVIDNGSVEISTSSYQETLQIACKDDGTGIHQDVLPKVFDPFFSTKDPGKGTGLGLSIAYSIVEEHGGKISIDSELGKGTVVTILLPLSS